MTKVLPGAVLPENVLQEVDELTELKLELSQERERRIEASQEAHELRERLEQWEECVRGALGKEREILDGLGWKKNA